MLVAKALASGNVLIMGVRRIFPGGGETATLCLSFSGCWRRDANGC